MRAMRIAFVLPGLAALFCLVQASAAEPAGHEPSCRVRYDIAVARIDQEEMALRAMFDADAATLEAPVYQLSETEAALRADLAEARARAAADYRACLTGGRATAR